MPARPREQNSSENNASPTDSISFSCIDSLLKRITFFVISANCCMSCVGVSRKRFLEYTYTVSTDISKYGNIERLRSILDLNVTLHLKSQCCFDMIFIEKKGSTQFCVLIYHCYLLAENSADAKKWLDTRYPDSALAERTVRKFKSGHPKGAVTPENVKKVQKIVLNDCKMQLSEIADTLKISTLRVYHILFMNILTCENSMGAA